MNCAKFEMDLTKLLAGEIPDGKREDAVLRLTAHVTACESCAESRDLLEFAATSPEERFPGEDPGEDYWESFDDRLKQRIERNGAARRFTLRHIAAVAAVIALVAVLGVWFLNGNVEVTTDEPPTTNGEDTIAWDGTHGVDPTSMEEEEAGWLFPDLDELDEEATQELLEWLQEETFTVEGGQA